MAKHLGIGVLLAGLPLYRDVDPGGEPVDQSVLYRELTLDRQGLDEEARTIPASLSSETEIKRFFGREKLIHTPEAVNLERARDGLPLLFGHDQDQPIGLVGDVKIADGKLRGVLRFSQNSRATEIWNDVREGFLKNISIGYRIEKHEESADDDLVTATRWTPFEASVVSVPADQSVGIGRSPEIAAAALAASQGGAAHLATRDDSDPVNVVELRKVRDEALEEGRREERKELLKRQAEISELFQPFVHRGAAFVQLRDEVLRRGQTVDQARDALYKLFAGEPEPLARDLVQTEGSANGEGEQVRTIETPQGRRREVVSGGKDAVENFRDGVTQALLVRVESLGDKEKIAEARKSEYLSMAPVEIAREYLRHCGVSVRGLSRDRIVSMALMQPGPLGTRGLISHSTSDFANILEDVANKSLQLGYEEAPETWSRWCRTGSIPDFRQANRPNISAFGDLDVVFENGEYKYGSFSDLKEVLTLLTYGKLFSISRQSLVNDDLNALGRIPNGMGRAAARKVGDLAYNVLINGITVTMNQDGIELFDAATHANFVAGGAGAAPSVATIDAARTAMAIQTDPSGTAILNVRPSFLIVPAALESTGKQIQMAEKDPAIASGEMPNVLRGTFETIADARLDADDPLKWYMAASPSLIETVEVAFLDGQQSPFLESQNGWSTDGVAYKVRIDATAAPLDFRGLYHNDGN